MRFRLVLLSLISIALYGLLAVRSDVDSGLRVFAQYYRSELFEGSVEFFGIWIALFGLYAVAVRSAAGRNERGLFAIIFTSSLLLRAAVFLGNGFDTSEPLAFLYGPSPLTTAVALLELGVGTERVLATLADVGALALAPSLLKSAKLPIGAAIVHGWNPLVIKEVAGSGRIEVVALALLLLSFVWIQRGSRWPAAIAFGASLTGPLMVAASLPLLAKALRARLVVSVGLALLAWAAAFPESSWLARAGWPATSSVGGSITPALDALAKLLVTRDALIPLAASLTMWALFVTIRAVRCSSDSELPREALLALGSFVLFSPQAFPWAFVAFAYVAAYSTNRGWLAFTATAPMTYLAIGEGGWSFWLGFAQYFAPCALLIFYWLGRSPHEAASAGSQGG